jgi:hypothetical protein
MPLRFNALLAQAGIAPAVVRLLRHQDNRSAKGRTPYEHGWLRFLGQISWRDKWICRPLLMISFVCLFVHRSYATQSDA